MPIKSRKVAKKAAPKPRKPAQPRRRGRPTAEAELARLIASVGVDPSLVDAKRVLASIAIDPEAPAGARVAAARALLVGAGKLPAEPEDADELDALSRRAISILAKGAKPN